MSIWTQGDRCKTLCSRADVGRDRKKKTSANGGDVMDA